jgi:integrase
MKVIEKNLINFSEIYGKKKWDKWLKTYSILQNVDVLGWLHEKFENYTREGKDFKKFNINSYFRDLQKYCDYNEVDNASDLLNEDLDTRNARLRTYLSDLLSQGRSAVSVKNGYQAKIKSFFSSRGHSITYQLKSEKNGANKREIILNKEKILLLKNGLNSSEYQLILKIQSQTGLRIGDVLDEITSGKYSIEKYKDHFFIRNFETQKEKVKISYLFFPTELSDLFISVTNTQDLTKIDLSTLFYSRTTKLKENKKRILGNNYLKRIKEIGTELGFKDNIKTHTFRTWFRSQAKRAIPDDREFYEHLMGHTQTNLSGSYNQDLRDIGWFYENWLIIEPFIMIDAKIVDKTNEEIVSLKEKIIQQEEQMKIVMKDNLKNKEENAKMKELLNESLNIFENRLIELQKTIQKKKG